MPLPVRNPKHYARNVRMTRAILNGYRLKEVAARFQLANHSSVMSGVGTFLRSLVKALPDDQREEGKRMLLQGDTSSENLYRDRKYWSPLVAAVEEELQRLKLPTLPTT